MKQIFSLLILTFLGLSFNSTSSNAQFILNQAWEDKYTGSDSLNDMPMAIDDITGSVYVAGITETPNSKILLIKYDQAGNRAWSKIYNLSANTRDEVYSIVIDDKSNVYVVGSSGNLNTNITSIVFLKYDPSGNLLLEKLYNDPANYFLSGGRQIEVDKNGNIYVMAGSTHKDTGAADLLLLKFNSSGILVWQRNYDGSVDTNNDFFFMKLDAKTSTLCLVGTHFTDAGRDFIILKYNFNGQRLWTNFYDGPANGSDRPFAMTLGPSGNIYVTGSSEGVTSGLDYATIKYNPAGTLQWIQRYNGTGNTTDVPNSIIADANYVYVTGTTLSLNNNHDFLTIKYAQSGALQWTNKFDGALSGLDEGVDLTVDKYGYVYVIGAEQQKSAMVFPSSWDMITLFIDPSGRQLAKLDYDDSTTVHEYPAGIAIDSKDGVYVVGAIYNQFTQYDITTVKMGKIDLTTFTSIMRDNMDATAKAIAHFSDDNVFINLVNNKVSQKFDGDFNSLLKDILPEMDSIFRKNLDQKFSSILKGQKLKQIPDFFKGFNYGEERIFPQIFIPQFDSIDKNKVPIIIPYLDLDDFNSDNKIKGYYLHNKEIRSVMLSEDTLPHVTVWVVSINDRVDRRGRPTLRTQQANVCGDTHCDPGETNANCPGDCPLTTCGTNGCEVGENPTNCPTDCPLGTCGNHVCEFNEFSNTCPVDCQNQRWKIEFTSMEIYDGKERWVSGASEVFYSYMFYNDNQRTSQINEGVSGFKEDYVRLLTNQYGWNRNQIKEFNYVKRKKSCKTRHAYTLKTGPFDNPNLVWNDGERKILGMLIYERDALARRRYVLPAGATVIGDPAEQANLAYKSTERPYGMFKIGKDAATYNLNFFNTNNTYSFNPSDCDCHCSSSISGWDYGVRSSGYQIYEINNSTTYDGSGFWDLLASNIANGGIKFSMKRILQP
jgi:hypothetical protein